MTDETQTIEEEIAASVAEEEALLAEEAAAALVTKHIMLDIETLGTSKNSVLLEIGAARFTADEVLDSFHVGVDPADCQRLGLELDASTVLWWFDPKRNEARERAFDMVRVDLFAALDGFAQWVAQVPAGEQGSIWGKGSVFDNVILENAYKAAGIPKPWGYKQDECYRTFANRFPGVEYEQIGTAHSGVDDAISQAHHLIRICRTHGIEL